MGSKGQYDGVRAASASTIEIDFYYAGQRCRERIKLKPSPANLKRTANHRAAVLDAIERGVFDYATTFPGSKNAARFVARGERKFDALGPYLEAWLDAKRPTIKASTWDGYRKTVTGVLVPHLGKVDIADLRRRHVREMCEEAMPNASNKRMANVQSVLRAALTEAVDDELLESNPLKDWTYRRNEPPKEDDDVDPFSPEEQAAILAALPGQGRNMIQFAFWTGLRPSEYIALRWSDVDIARRTVRVRRAITQAAKGQAETTKTTSGNRVVKLLEPAVQALKAQRVHTYMAEGVVFINPRTGEPWAGDGPIRKTMWAHAIRKAGVRYRIPYQTRHTYASMMLSAGENPIWLAAQMGHRDWSVIKRKYARWMPSADPTAGSRAEALFGSETGNQADTKNAA